MTMISRIWSVRVLMCLVVWAGGRESFAQETNGVDASDFEYFSIISDRNIFNPNRFRRSENVASSVEIAREPEPAIEFFTLYGTMIYEQGTFAYFGGSDEAFRKALRIRDTIGGLEVVDISPSHVRLDNAGEALTLGVGMQLKRRDQGEWELVREPERSGTKTSSRSQEQPTSSRPEVASAGNAASEDDDILKRLMQKREQELEHEKN